MSVCSSGSPPLAFIWFSLHVIHLANKSSSSSSSSSSYWCYSVCCDYLVRLVACKHRDRVRILLQIASVVVVASVYSLIGIDQVSFLYQTYIRPTTIIIIIVVIGIIYSTEIRCAQKHGTLHVIHSTRLKLKVS